MLRGNTKALVKFNQTRSAKGDFYCTSYLGQSALVDDADLWWNVQFLNELGPQEEVLGYFLNAYSPLEDASSRHWWQLLWQGVYQYWLLGKDHRVLSNDQLRQLFAHAPQGMTSLTSVQRLNVLESGLSYLKTQEMLK